MTFQRSSLKFAGVAAVFWGNGIASFALGEVWQFVVDIATLIKLVSLQNTYTIIPCIWRGGSNFYEVGVTSFALGGVAAVCSVY